MFGAMGDKDKETKWNKKYNIDVTQIYQNKIVNVWLVLLWDNKYKFYFICRSWENQLQYLIFFFSKRKDLNSISFVFYHNIFYLSNLWIVEKCYFNIVYMYFVQVRG